MRRKTPRLNQARHLSINISPSLSLSSPEDASTGRWTLPREIERGAQALGGATRLGREMGDLLPTNQSQHRTCPAHCATFSGLETGLVPVPTYGGS